MPILELHETDKFGYDKGENRHKHNWNKAVAGVVREGKRLVGKCYHAFPVTEVDDPGILKLLRDRASASGHARDLRRWMENGHVQD